VSTGRKSLSCCYAGTRSHWHLDQAVDLVELALVDDVADMAAFGQFHGVISVTTPIGSKMTLFLRVDSSY
jgi:hypothetical protein